MPDITLCNHTSCYQKQECYRYMALPNEQYQSYCDFKEICHEGTEYRMFMEIRSYDKLRSEMLENKEEETKE